MQKHYNESVKASMGQDLINAGYREIRTDGKVRKTLDVHSILQN